jgi:hypothetical protein
MAHLPDRSLSRSESPCLKSISPFISAHLLKEKRAVVDLTKLIMLLRSYKLRPTQNASWNTLVEKLFVSWHLLNLLLT